MAFLFDDMVKLKASVVEFNKTVHKVHMDVAMKVAQLAIRKVKKLTPVDTGDLRNNWKSHIVKKGDTYYIHIYNQVEYASFVELGHRIVSQGKTVGWKEGYFMLTLTADEMESVAPNMWEKLVAKEMKRLFD